MNHCSYKCELFEYEPVKEFVKVEIFLKQTSKTDKLKFVMGQVMKELLAKYVFFELKHF